MYFDYCASTPVNPEVLDIFCAVSKNMYANPSSVHKLGYQASSLIEESREKISKLFKIAPSEIVFTSGATESNNLAILGVVRASRKVFASPHIIISAIEHSSVYSCAEYLKKDNVEVTILPVDSNGLVSIKQLEESLKENTVLVSIMYANNETGVIQPIKEIGEMLKLHNQVSFHVDGVQAVGKMEIALGSIDLFTFSGHKIGGPKGIGALIVKSNTVIAPIIWGGGQEYGIRPGTENVPAIASLAHAVEICILEQLSRTRHLQDIHHYIYNEIRSIPELEINSPRGHLCAPHILNFSYRGVPSSISINILTQKGILVSSQSACSSKSNKFSRVLLAITNDKDIASSSIRLSFSEATTFSDADVLLQEIQDMVKQIKTNGKYSYAHYSA
ncbi:MULTISPECIES: cysteine desulfurase family protein [Paenibacillus]|uniref:cysteine desulfurase n=1 Tax=Paenibacillus borealis TaxID=160799 RepID=A0ABX3GT76_PAEBO|nr:MULTISPECIES: cysteine desulfurase family protein [Paenibacillus]AIQ16582.1 hypothetical protein H70357_07765 [Paenibacillus sp. FSL H7-0357]OMD36692.1 hypothetical protein BSK56_31965 [Paenibacillus borealis]